MERKKFVSEPYSVLVRPLAKALITPKNYLRVISQPAWPFRTAWMLLRLARAGQSQRDFITGLVPGLNERSADDALAELRSNVALYEHVKDGMDAVLELTQGRIPGWMPLVQAEALYVLVRGLRPSRIVETGVGHGMSTTFILQALADNNSGQLHSIDVPIRMRVDEHPSGCLVPDHLKDRWDLVLGESKTELPPILSKLDSVDIFLHDSDHSAENMDFEYQEAWPHVVKGGLMLTDDIGPEFVRFGDRVNHRIARFNRLGGFTRN